VQVLTPARVRPDVSYSCSTRVHLPGKLERHAGAEPTTQIRPRVPNRQRPQERQGAAAHAAYLYFNLLPASRSSARFGRANVLDDLLTEVPGLDENLLIHVSPKNGTSIFPLPSPRICTLHAACSGGCPSIVKRSSRTPLLPPLRRLSRRNKVVAPCASTRPPSPHRCQLAPPAASRTIRIAFAARHRNAALMRQREPNTALRVRRMFSRLRPGLRWRDPVLACFEGQIRARGSCHPSV